MVGIEEYTWRRRVSAAVQSRRGHAIRTHLPKTRKSGNSAPVVPPRVLPHAQAAWDSLAEATVSSPLRWAGTSRRIYPSGEEAFGTRRPSTATRPFSWISATQTRRRGYTYEEAVLTMTDKLPPPPRRASANTSLVRDKCPSTTRATNFPSFAVDNFWRLGVEGGSSSLIS